MSLTLDKAFSLSTVKSHVSAVTYSLDLCPSSLGPTKSSFLGPFEQPLSRKVVMNLKC